MVNTYSIQQASTITQVSKHTLRYYEREGLLTIARTASGHRRYTDDDLGWVRFIMLLKRTNMPLPEIARFVRLEKDGHDTINKRRTMLEEHRIALTAHIAQLHTYMDALDTKIDYYSDVNNELLDCVQDKVIESNTSTNGKRNEEAV
ncbi:MAG: MerR family transcriptional regulator [Chloroflexota bacterium]